MKAFKNHSLLWISAFLFTCVSPESTRIDSRVKEIDQFVSYYHENGMLNGTILVAEADRLIYREALGYADFESQKALNPQTLFYIASMSKQFTTMAIMILKERGLLSYEDKLSSFFDDFPEYGDDVTIRHLMTHTSGVPDYFALNVYKPGLTNRDIYEVLIELDSLNFTPGSKYAYSNGGYVLLSMIVEKVSGDPFHLFMKENIFQPLGMNNTLVYDTSAPALANRAVGYNLGRLDDYEILTTGDGGMFSNVDDLHRWLVSLSKNPLVSQNALDEAFTPYVLSNGDTTTYGYGWGVDLEVNRINHGGQLSGYRTYLTKYLDTNVAFILLTNNGDAFNWDIVDQFRNLLEGKDVEWLKIPVSSFLQRNLTIENSDSVFQALESALSAQSDYELDEIGINTLGYSYLNDKNLVLARAVFLFNLKQFPNSSNVYDSYGEVLLASGDTASAVENYLRSVELNPNNQNGIDVLTGLGLDESEFLRQVDVPLDLLEKYVGTYQFSEDFIVKVTLEDGLLYVSANGQGKDQIFPASQARFYLKIVNAQMTFHIDESGTVDSLTLHQNGDNPGTRIE